MARYVDEYGNPIDDQRSRVATTQPRPGVYVDDDGMPIEEDASPPSFGEEAVNAARSFNDMLMFGGGDEYEGAANTIGDLVTGKIGLGDVPETFGRHRRESVQQRQAFEQRQPLASVAAKSAGGALPLLAVPLTGGASAAPGLANSINTARVSATPVLDAVRSGTVWGSIGGWLSADPNAEGGRALGAVSGAGAGAVVGGALSGLANAGVSRGPTVEDKATAMVGRALKEGDALKPPAALNPKTKSKAPTEIERRSYALKAQGGPVAETIAEIGGTGAKGLARAVAVVPGPGQQVAQDTLYGRADGIGKRVVSAARSAAGKPQDYGEAVINMATAGKAKQRASYDAAMKGAENVGIAPAETKGLASDIDNHLYDVETGPGIVPNQTSLTGLQRARTVIENIEKMTATGKFTLRGVERYRQQLNQIYGSAKTSGDGYDAGAVQQVIRQLDDRLEKAANARAQAGNPTFRQQLNQIKATRQDYGTMKSTEEAMEQGRRVLRDDASDTYLWMNNDGQGRSQAEADGYMVGVMKAIEDAVNRNDTAAIGRLQRDKNIQTALNQALGEKGASKLLTRVSREVSMNATKNAVLSGSRTTPTREEVDRWTKGEDDMAWLSDMIMNPTPVRNVFLKAFQGIYNRANRPGIYNPEVNKAVADILYSRASDTAVRKLLFEINRDPQLRQAARAAMQRQNINDRALIDNITPRAGAATGGDEENQRPRDVWISSSRNLP